MSVTPDTLVPPELAWHILNCKVHGLPKIHHVRIKSGINCSSLYQSILIIAQAAVTSRTEHDDVSAPSVALTDIGERSRNF